MDLILECTLYAIAIVSGLCVGVYLLRREGDNKADPWVTRDEN